MAAYRLLIMPSAAKEIAGAGKKQDRQRIVARIQALAIDPRPQGCEKLAGGAERYRVRQGDYRIVYSIDDSTHEVVVVRIGHRREVYR